VFGGLNVAADFLGMLFAPKRTLAKAGAKRDALRMTEVTRRVPIAALRRRCELLKESYAAGAEREAYMRAVDAWMSSLQSKYGTSMPFQDFCVPMPDEFKAEIERLRRSQ
jgi:hypothetical protein